MQKVPTKNWTWSNWKMVAWLDECGWLGVCCLPEEHMAPECREATWCFRLFCLETLGPSFGCPFDVNTYLNIIVDQVYSFIQTVYIMPCHTAKMVQKCLHISVFELASTFPSSHFNWVSVRCAGQTSLIHRGPTSQPKRTQKICS